jgi:hypothetical protein
MLALLVDIDAARKSADKNTLSINSVAKRSQRLPRLERASAKQ